MKEHPIHKGYFADETGRVFSNKGANKSVRELKPIKMNTGYYILFLCCDKQRVSILHHRFIAEIFLPNPNNYLEINHKDEDKSNNRVENLEWCDRHYNMKYSKDKLANSNSKWFIIENVKTGDVFEIFNLKKWCEENQVDRTSVYKVINGKYKHTKNFVIKRMEVVE